MIDERLHPSFEDDSFQEDPALALEALEADVGADSHYFPFVAAAGMWLPQPDDITHLYVQNHVRAVEWPTPLALGPLPCVTLASGRN